MVIDDLWRWKAEGRRVVAITAYDAPMAALCEAAGVDLILVGDSLGNTVLGLPDTLGVTMADMLRHTQAVARAVARVLLVADMPFLSYQTSPADAVRHAGALLQAGAAAVKLEGGAAWAETVRRLVCSGIPVFGHLGYTPQSIRRFGRPRVQGRDERAAAALRADAAALTEAGISALVLEMVPAPLAARLTAELPVPTIGIGAGAGCDGQILVLHDVIGLSPRTPRFARRYAAVGESIRQAVAAYAADVREHRFPGREQTHDGSRWGGPAAGGDGSGAGDGR